MAIPDRDRRHPAHHLYTVHGRVICRMSVERILCGHERLWLVVLGKKEIPAAGEDQLLQPQRMGDGDPDRHVQLCPVSLAAQIRHPLAASLAYPIDRSLLGRLGERYGMGRYVAAGETQDRELDIVEYFQRIRHSPVIIQAIAALCRPNPIPFHRSHSRVYPMAKDIIEMNTIPHPSHFIPAALADTINQSSGEAERYGSLHPRQLALIYEQRWFSLFVPLSRGGLGLSLPEGLELEEGLAWADGSTGWTVTLCGGANWFIGFLQPAIAWELFSDQRVCLA